MTAASAGLEGADFFHMVHSALLVSRHEGVSIDSDSSEGGEKDCSDCRDTAAFKRDDLADNTVHPAPGVCLRPHMVLRSGRG